MVQILWCAIGFSGSSFSNPTLEFPIAEICFTKLLESLGCGVTHQLLYLGRTFSTVVCQVQ